MVSKTTFVLLALGFAVVLLISSQMVAAKDLDASQVEDAKYGGGYYNGGGRGRYNNGGGRGRYNNGGGRGGGYCNYGCCGGGGYYTGGCRCCKTSVEATAYKQAHDQAQTHN